MLSLLVASLFIVGKVLSDGHGHGNGDHDHGAHESHRHADETLPHCECITGVTTEMLNCTDQATVTYLESLLMDNNCKSTCGYNVTSDRFDLKCSQWFALLIQYHDWCELLTVTEELIHDLWDVCSLDCLQDYPITPGAPYCSEDIRCDNKTSTNLIIDTAINQCNATTCMAVDSMDTINCTDQLRLVEGAHRMCAHSDLSEDFDEKFDMYINLWGLCDGIECNVPDTIDVNCSLERNIMIASLPQWTGLDQNDLSATLAPVIAPTSSPTEHDHKSHSHSDETLPHCECITGIMSSDLNCMSDQEIIDELEGLLVSKNCMTKCAYPVGSAMFDLECNQLFALLIQYHDWCELLTVDETLIHDLWDTCAFDCLQDFQYIPGAPYCDGSFDCEMPSMMDTIINKTVTYCNATSCMPYDESSALNCTEQIRMVEGIHRMCSHEDITENFDEKFDMYIDLWGLCDGIQCNVPDTIDVNCSLQRNVNITSLPGFNILDLNDLSGTDDTPVDDDASNLSTLFCCLISLIVMIALQ